MRVCVIDTALFLSFLLFHGSSGCKDRAGFLLQEAQPLLFETPHLCVLAISLLTAAHLPRNTIRIFSLHRLFFTQPVQEGFLTF